MDNTKNINSDSASRVRDHRKNTPSVSTLAKGIIKGDPISLARGLTLVESTRTEDRLRANTLIESCLKQKTNSVRIGITGVPGVGKSTFIETLGCGLTAMNKKVAVLAVDPTSSISKGSILGDKTRMARLVKDPMAFIRPSPSGESLGGVARSTREGIVLCEAAGFDIILVETVGVGQSETAVHSMVDFFLLLKLAGAGDELQGMKRGIVEMADALVINKADGDNEKPAALAKSEFERALHLYPPKADGWTPKVLTCSALKNEGIEDIWRMIEGYVRENKRNGHFVAKRKIQNKNWFLQTLEHLLHAQFYSSPEVAAQIDVLLRQVEEYKISPFRAAESLLENFVKLK